MPRTLSQDTTQKVGAVEELPAVQPTPKPKMILWIILAVLAAILLIGWVVWTYQKTIREADKLAAEQNVLTLKKQVLQDETADWQTYTNDEYGFEIKVPNGFKVTQENDYINLLNEKEKYNITIINNKEQIGFPECFSEERDKVVLGENEWRIYDFICGDSELYKSQDAVEYITFGDNSDKFVNFSVSQYQKRKESFNQILSTFRFINSCLDDNECQTGEVCFNSLLCGELTADGENCGPQLGDLQCHKLCQSDDDCPAETPKCEEKEIWIGDAGLAEKFCVK